MEVPGGVSPRLGEDKYMKKNERKREREKKERKREREKERKKKIFTHVLSGPTFGVPVNFQLLIDWPSFL